MTHSQLRKDLARRLDERLRQWARDGMDLYNMAGLSPKDASQDLFASLLFFTVEGCIALDLDPETFCDMITKSINSYKAEEK